jgi:hypothetical protein
MKPKLKGLAIIFGYVVLGVFALVGWEKRDAPAVPACSGSQTTSKTNEPPEIGPISNGSGGFVK